ncbi:hypothetical protein INQ51_11460 [Maribellus sp. CM-23]|uniref:hypothetical protein n=1 Tax=Maribellus sp. CM-23 TaxID=2781026 RepID=UPI001F2ED90B|nr:hypothetical protein [Maribellus sp. CM-23]MCE4564927.1 hypothetical protein [Maribellus sp. CM-23]
MRKLITTSLILLVVFSVQSVFAQEEAPKPRYVVWEVCVEPAQMDLLLNALDAMHSFLGEKDYPYRELIQRTNDGYLWASSPIESLGDIDKMREAEQKIWKDNAEKMEALGKNFENTYQKVGALVLELQPNLSVMPEQPGTQTSGTKFRVYEKFHLKNGKYKEFEAATKKYVELRKKHGYNQPFYTFYPVLAPDMSVVYFVDELGSNPVDYYTKNEEQWQKFGEEGAQLWEEVKPLITGTEHHLGFIDFDHSYLPDN